MEGVQDEVVIISVLQRVIDGALTLKEMDAEMLRHKWQIHVENTFKASFNLDSFDACK